MRKIRVLCLMACMLVTMSGCGAASKFAESADTAASISASAENYAAQEMGGGYFTEEVVVEEAEVDWESGESVAEEIDCQLPEVVSARKLIKTVDINVETKEFDQVMATLEQQVNSMGGYIEHMETYNGSTYSGYQSARDANLTIRIPKDRLEVFLNTISDISNVVRRSENVEDVTLAYVDIESRRNALQTEQERLLELLAIAENVEEIIIIEDRLSSVRYELESMESQLRTYDNKIDYSTVYLYIEEVRELTPIVEETVWQRITGGFAESLEDIGYGFVEFGIWFIVHIPYMVIWVVIIIVAVVICKTVRKKRRIHKQKNQETAKQ